jgi:acid stress chaperone HdeB
MVARSVAARSRAAISVAVAKQNLAGHAAWPALAFVTATQEETMIRAGAVVVAALLVLPSVPARAEVLDLATMSCKQFVESGDDMIKLVLIWMDGWYKGDSDEAIIDTDVFTQNAKKFGAYCAVNPTVSIVNAAEKILGK